MKDQVLIAGAGPVGLTMALKLARYGVPVRIIDKIPEATRTSRAVAVWPRTLELLDRSGAAADIIVVGNKVTVANILSSGRTVASFALDAVPSPYPFALMVPQYETEAVLRRHLAAHGVKPDLGVELLGFEQDEDGLSARLREPDGTERTEPYAFLVACDGAHSLVRHHLGLDFKGDTLGLVWTQGDFTPERISLPLLADGHLLTRGRAAAVLPHGARPRAHHHQSQPLDRNAARRAGPGGVPEDGGRPRPRGHHAHRDGVGQCLPYQRAAGGQLSVRAGLPRR